jgi:hypothetical protein
MAKVGQVVSRPSPIIYALLGVLLALALQLLLKHMSGHTIDLLRNTNGYTVEGARQTLTQAELSDAQQQLRRWTVAVFAAHWLVLGCQCGLAFWVSRRAAPQWGWGAWVGAPALLMHVVTSLSLDATWTGYLIRSWVWVLLKTAAIAIAAFLGGSFRTKERL